ncbi:hypothetical protein GCM10022251_30960 [Phytohabitans flavus]|uniref:Glycosyl transferase family 28 C-terminal domain-containing protein n=1 Tax=Phytohabitans flavus TaxID=1076124 RepID=A0A6F8XX50_9ACTN|nr:hypothetical protein [Phytohabitans flavus]BCB78311.1 hypothetical protein Pflav_047210 [Phytohabitans flavus]
MISHGGACTMLGAFAHGLPQLILPQAAAEVEAMPGADEVMATLTGPGTTL